MGQLILWKPTEPQHPPPPPPQKESSSLCSCIESRLSDASYHSRAPTEADMVLVLKWHVRDGGTRALHFGMPQWTMDMALLGTSLPWQLGLQMVVVWVEEAFWTWTRHLSKGLTVAYTLPKRAARRACQETGAIQPLSKMTSLVTGQSVLVNTIDHRTRPLAPS